MFNMAVKYNLKIDREIYSSSWNWQTFMLPLCFAFPISEEILFLTTVYINRYTQNSSKE